MCETFRTIEWEADLVNLGTFGRHVQFYIGDKILEGWDSEYIERGVYDRAAELTEINIKTLQHYVWTCKAISSRRREELNWAHHYEVAKYETWESSKQRLILINIMELAKKIK